MVFGNILFGISLLLLSVSGNFVGETLGCRLQKQLSQNMLLKHTLILFIIFFSIGLSNDILHPVTRFCITLLVYLLYLSISRISIHASILVFLLLLLATILHTCQEYVERDVIKEHYQSKLDTWNIMYIIIFSFILITIIVGITHYIRSKKKKYKNNWSTKVFLFGNATCTYSE